MKKTQHWTILLGIVFLNVSLTPILYSQMGPGSGRSVSKYDPKTETTVQAVVEEVRQVTGKGSWSGTHLMVKAESGVLEVHVGPSAYVAG